MKRLLVAALFLLAAPAFATTYFFSGCGFNPNDSARNDIRATTGDACGSSDGVAGYTGCGVCVAPADGSSTGSLPPNFCGTTVVPNLDFGPNELTRSSGSFDHYTYVDEFPNDGDTTYLQPTTDGQKEVFSVDSSLMPTTATTVTAVTIVAVQKGTVADATTFHVGVEIPDDDGTAHYYPGVDWVQVATSYQFFVQTFQLNPKTNAAWTTTDVQLLHPFYEVVTAAVGLPRARLSSLTAFVSFSNAPPIFPPSSGTLTNPWCLDPSDDGVRSSFAQFSDGGTGNIVTELAANDVVTLCAGDCDGHGSETFYLQSTGTTTVSGSDEPHWLVPQANTITVNTFFGEHVTLSGDTSGNGLPDPTDITMAIDQATTAKTGWVWKGVDFSNFAPTNGGEIFYLNNNPDGWIFDGVTAHNLGGYAWTSASLESTPCSKDSAPHLFKVADLTGTFIVRNSKVWHSCVFAHRNTVNASATSILIDSNEYWDLPVVSNDFIGNNITYSNNYIHDVVEGISVEEDMTNVVIEGNVLACRGDFTPDSQYGGHCYDAIRVTNGDNGSTEVTSHDITIARNRIYGVTVGGYRVRGGWWQSPLSVHFNNPNAANNVTIENNMFWKLAPWTTIGSGPVESASLYLQLARASGTEVVVQNNTFDDAFEAIYLDGLAAVDYMVRDNLLYQNRAGTVYAPGVTVNGAASGSHIQNNMVTNGNDTHALVSLSGVTQNCSSIASFNASNRSGNFCPRNGSGQGIPPAFVSNGVSPTCWDLHLLGFQYATDAGVAASTEDIDTDPRPIGPATDVGADEWPDGTFTCPCNVLTCN
jgi:hypothetical protein